MADKKISELTAATTVNDDDQLPLVQAGETLSIDASVLRAYVVQDSVLVKVDVNQVLSVANSITERGHYSKGAFNGTYTDGIVLDYVTGTGRISVGSSDGLSIYNGGVAGTALLNLDSSGNLGLGVATATWYSASKAIQLGATGTIEGRSGVEVFQLGSNWYINTGGSYAYTTTAASTRYSQTSGGHYWYTAPSGTAGSAISFTQAMTLTAAGYLGVGTTSPVGLLHVSGGGNVYFATNSGSTTNVYLDNGVLSSVGSTVPLKFGINGSEVGRFSSAGYLGIGTSSPVYQFQTNISNPSNGVIGQFYNTATSAQTGAFVLFTQNNIADWYVGQAAGASALTFGSGKTSSTAGTEFMRLDSSGNLGLGVTPSAWYNSYRALQTQGGSISAGTGDINFTQNAYLNATAVWTYSNTATASKYTQYNGEHYWFTAPSGTAGAAISFTQAMTLDASGNLIVGTTSGASNLFYRTDNFNPTLIVRNGAASGTIYGLNVNYSGLTANNTTSFFLQCNDPSAERATIRSNGGLANYSANNVNLSDERVKTDITPATSWLAKINAIEVVNFKYKDQTHDDFNLGVIAQQVQSVAPELVDTDGFGETPENGIPLMAIYETDLKYAMLKAIQELHAELQALKATLH